MASRNLSAGSLRRRSAATEHTGEQSSAGSSNKQHARTSQDTACSPSSARSTSTAAFADDDDAYDDEQLEGMFVGSSGSSCLCSSSDLLLAIAGLLFTFSFTAYIFPAIVVALLYRILAKGSLDAGAALALLILHMSVPIPEEAARPSVLEAINRLMFRPWRRYFDFQIITETDLDKSSAYVLAAYPHGIFPMGQWLSNPHLPMLRRGDDFSCTSRKSESWQGGQHDSQGRRCAPEVVFPVTCVGGVANIMRHIPLFRYLFSAVATVSVSRHKLLSNLLQGTSVMLIPGGIAEIYCSDTEREVIILKDRKGFVRLALQTGLPLVPVYCLGNTSVFRLVSISRKFTKICRALKVGATIFYGRWGLPIPFKTKLIVVVGRPIEMPQLSWSPSSSAGAGGGSGGGDDFSKDNNRHRLLPEPPEELVNAVHAQYVEALCDLFHRHKHRLPGWEERELVVI